MTGSALAIAPASAEPLPPTGSMPRSLRSGLWSYSRVMVHTVPAQNVSCAAASA